MSQTKKDLILSHYKDQLKTNSEEEIFGIHNFVEHFLGQFISKDTKRAYLKDLSSFFQFFSQLGEPITNPSNIRPKHFEVYRDYLTDKKQSSATINRRLVGIRSFIKWCLASGYIQKNPLDLIKLPKVQTENPTQALDDHEALAIMNAPDLTKPKEITHRLVLVLLFKLGLRRGELSKIKKQDIQYTRGHCTLKIRGKGSKIRILPLPESVKEEIDQYLELKQSQGIIIEAEDYLVQIHAKKKSLKPINGSTIFRLVVRYAKQLGIERKISPHSCRATVISHLLDTQKTPIRDVAIFAGHSNITTTERYDKRRENLDSSAAYSVDFDKKAS